MSDTNSMGGGGTSFNPPFLEIETPSMGAVRAADNAAGMARILYGTQKKEAK